MGDGSVIARALFVPPRFIPNNDLLDGLGCKIDDTGWAVKNSTGQISGALMSNPSTTARPAPPTNHQLALMIWLAVLPTLTVINLVFGELLATLHPVIYGIMPHLHRLRARLVNRRTS